MASLGYMVLGKLDKHADGERKRYIDVDDDDDDDDDSASAGVRTEYLLNEYL